MRPLIDDKEVARRAGNNVSMWQKLRVTGGGPTFHKVGRLVRYDWADVEIWLAARRRTSTSQEAPDARAA